MTEFHLVKLKPLGMLFPMTAKRAMGTKSSNQGKKLKFIDLFAGIGGFHLALHNLGAECVFASEWDKHARETYEHNFKKKSPELFKNGNFAGDITKVEKSEIPDFDILTPAFHASLSVKSDSRKVSRTPEGHSFDIAEIIKIKQPQAYFLENVRHLYKHDEVEHFPE